MTAILKMEMPSSRKHQTLTIRHSEAEALLSKCTEYFEQQEEAEADLTQMLLLRNICNTSARKAHGMLRQNKMRLSEEYLQVCTST